MIDNTLTGQNIIAHRQRLGWTQGELARRLSITHQAVSKWENGVALPDISTLLELSRLFGVSMEELLTGTVQPAPAPQPADSPEDVPSPDPAESVFPNALPEAQPSSPSCDWKQIVALAPFASRETLDRLVSQCIESCDTDALAALAPFLSRDTLDKLVLPHMDSGDLMEHILTLAPFLSRSTLDKLVLQNLENGDWPDLLPAIAPFLSRSTLDKLVLQYIDSNDLMHYLPVLAPFLSRQTLDRLILHGTWHTQADSSVHSAEQNEACWEEAAADAERNEARYELLARQAEYHEQRHKAEQMEEYIHDKIARVVESQFERAVQRASSYAFPGAPVPAVQDASSDRRTEIQDAHPAASTPTEYAQEVLRQLHAVCDADDPAVSRFGEIRRAIEARDFAALNEFAPLLDAHIGPQWLEEYAALCGDGEVPPDFANQLDLAITQRNWPWIEEHAHLISDPELVRRIALVSSSEGFFDFIPLFLDQLDQASIDHAARQAVRLGRTEDILPFAAHVSPGVL